MYVRGTGVTFADVKRIAESVAAEQYGGNVIVHQDAKPIGTSGYGFQGRIVGMSSSGQGVRRSWSGRRGQWACWHAYRDVMRAVLTAYPHAVIRTAMARYDGLSGFESTYPGTADVNVGSEVQPAYMSELCACDDPE